MADVIRLYSQDTVAVAVRDLSAGETVFVGDEAILIKNQIRMGHKIALRDLEEGEDVIRYGVPIGHAVQPISRGEWVHDHNLFTNRPRSRNIPSPPILGRSRGYPGRKRPPLRGILGRAGRWAYETNCGSYPRSFA